jgi:membrane protease YdiL (CAAX protease family)
MSSTLPTGSRGKQGVDFGIVEEYSQSGENDTVQLALISLFVVIAVVLVVRAARRDRVEYREFKKLTTTAERQKVFGKWLRESFFIFGGLSAAVLLASWQFVPLAATSALDWPPLTWLKNLFAGGFGVGFAIGASIVFVLLLVLPVILLRAQISDIPTVGDIGSLLPRTRGELIYGIGLSLNAGLVEELLFRFGMPALLFGITGNGVVAFALASVLFGLLHLYQKVWGVLGATLLGIALSLLFLITGSIWVVIIVHALIDLRSLVLIPLVVGKVWGKNETPAGEPVVSSTRT